jgi:hypothetical protein
MKYAAVKAFRAKLQADETVSGLWVTLESASITEVMNCVWTRWSSH